LSMDPEIGRALLAMLPVKDEGSVHGDKYIILLYLDLCLITLVS
jgi:hypothetical protein